MSTSDENQSQPHGGEQGSATGAATAPQAETGANVERGQRHGRRRHGRTERRGGEQRQQPQRRGGEATLNMEELRELTELFSTHGLTDFEFENADIRIRLSRTPAPVVAAAPVAAPAQALTPLAALQSATQAAPVAEQTQSAPPAESSTASAQAPAESETSEEELHLITSPIVGTFYRSPSPNAEPFVKVGSHVDAETVVCIIEAMKLMNEIQAEAAGTVVKVYVENNQPVEYGQPLFGIKK
ncbi:MAG TPA: acetyl-CoA carboxylase biotin carboxyl carrier protein [Pyrinomonadaceae bacterium]|nr:acetyl-CoA carboxylase biotin carboxyl carrier protein [Pyrinomonadaceae bacterium]